MVILHASKPIALIVLLSILAACGGVPAAQAPTNATVATAVTGPTAAPVLTQSPASTAAPAASTASYPITIENCGRTLTFEKSPERVVVAYQPLAEIMIALGLGHTIVGVQYGQAQEPLPEQAAEFNTLPWLVEPNAGSASKEVLISTNPDFVLVSYFAYDIDPASGGASEADYAAAGAQVYGMATDAPCLASDETFTMETIYRDISTLGTIFAVAERADALIADMRGRIDAVRATVADQPLVSAVYYEDGAGPFTIYGGGLANEQLTLAGGTNTLADQGDYVQVGAEVIAASNADVLVIADCPGFEPVATRAAFLFATFPALPASQNKRSVGINCAAAGVGIRLPSAVEDMARAFHPERFK